MGRKGEFTLDGTSEDKKLTARFRKVHGHASLEIRFQRTVRVPNDGRVYALPSGLGVLPLRHLDDYLEKLPREWADRGGVIMPMFANEAMWIEFSDSYPCAIKIGAGKINVLNGLPWTERLDACECDYLAAPPQPALDGFRTDDDVVRQFVAVPLGSGSTVEEQITGEGTEGGLQIVVYPMKKAWYDRLREEHAEHGGSPEGPGWHGMTPFAAGAPDRKPLALAAGGQMHERVYKDPHGVDAWDQAARTRCFVTLIDAARWHRVTGVHRPLPPLSLADYEAAGMPWFEYDGAGLEPLAGTSGLDGVGSAPGSEPADGLQVLDASGAAARGRVRKLNVVRPPRRTRHPSPGVRAFWGAVKLLRGQ